MVGESQEKSQNGAVDRLSRGLNGEKYEIHLGGDGYSAADLFTKYGQGHAFTYDDIIGLPGTNEEFS